MKKQYPIVFCLFALSVFNNFSQDLPRIEPLTLYSKLSTEDNLTYDEFLSLAFYASESRENSRGSESLREYIEALKWEVTPINSEYERGEKVLKLLHETLFSKYIEDQTKITTLMEEGTFNCVSSAVIFMAVAKVSGLEIQGVKTRDHAFISLVIDNEIIDIETTNEWGFDPGKKKEFTDSFSGSTGYNYVPPGNYSLRTNINEKQMIGLILQNRMAELQRRNNHLSSVPLAVDRFALTLSEEAQKDMYDSFSNYSSQLNAMGQYEKGIEFLENAISLWGSSTNIRKALEALTHNQVLKLLDNDNFDEAKSFLSRMERENLISSTSIETDRFMIYDKITVDMLNSPLDFNEIEAHLNQTYSEGFLAKSKWVEYTLYNYIKKTEIIANDLGWLEAYHFAKDAPLEIHNQRKYNQLLNSCKSNYIITLHNEFAELYNNALYNKAKDVVNLGLLHFPNDRTLKSDLNMINKKTLQ